MNRLFVYGIFLAPERRQRYGMGQQVQYAIVRDYVTVPIYHDIVEAIKVAPESGIALTGLVVDLPHNFDWERLDRLEGGYSREVVKTSEGNAYMYVGKEIA